MRTENEQECVHGMQKYLGSCAFCERDAAEEALREIMILCGGGDPSDGEGTSPEEVVAVVQQSIKEFKKTITNKDKAVAKFQRLYDALKSISRYDNPERVRTDAPKMGLDEDEAVGMAYENVISEAKSAIRGMKRPI